jgi:hypothetical protein
LFRAVGAKLFIHNFSFFIRITCNVMRRLRLLVGVWFQIYFTPLSGVLFTFPSRYLFTIGLQEYLAFPVSTGRFIRAIRVSNYSGSKTKEIYVFRIQDYYLLGSYFPAHFSIHTFCNSSQLNAVFALQPHPCKHEWFGLFPFRSPLLRESQEPSS